MSVDKEPVHNISTSVKVSVTVSSVHIAELLTNAVRSVSNVCDPLLAKSGKFKLIPQPCLSNSPNPVEK